MRGSEGWHHASGKGMIETPQLLGMGVRRDSSASGTQGPQKLLEERGAVSVLGLRCRGTSRGLLMGASPNMTQREDMLTTFIWKNRRRVLSSETIPPHHIAGAEPRRPKAGASAGPGGGLVNASVRGVGCGQGAVGSRGRRAAVCLARACPGFPCACSSGRATSLAFVGFSSVHFSLGTGTWPLGCQTELILLWKTRRS